MVATSPYSSYQALKAWNSSGADVHVAPEGRAHLQAAARAHLRRLPALRVQRVQRPAQGKHPCIVLVERRSLRVYQAP